MDNESDAATSSDSVDDLVPRVCLVDLAIIVPPLRDVVGTRVRVEVYVYSESSISIVQDSEVCAVA